MKGKMLIYRAAGSLADPPEIRAIHAVDDWSNAEANMDALRRIVEDDLEVVPLFDTIMSNDRAMPCVAFCGEHSKFNRHPPNRRATLLWRSAIAAHDDMPPQMREYVARDVLVGTVVILTGDPEFMGLL